MKQLLASLIARVQKVLLIQRDIYDGTVRLEKVPVAERSHVHEIESGRLSLRERGIVRDVEEALALLREEGSAVAMPEALEQVRDDMVQIENRLGQGKTEVLTQAIETDVIKELEEIVDAFKKAKEKRGEPEEAAQPFQRRAARSAADRAAGGVEDDPRLAVAREPPHRPLFEAHRAGPRAGHQGGCAGRPAAPGRPAEAGPRNHPGPGNGQERVEGN